MVTFPVPEGSGMRTALFPAVGWATIVSIAIALPVMGIRIHAFALFASPSIHRHGELQLVLTCNNT